MRERDEHRLLREADAQLALRTKGGTGRERARSCGATGCQPRGGPAGGTLLEEALENLLDHLQRRLITREARARDSGDLPQQLEGLVVGEGAGALVLESYEHAMARGAEILCELHGYASNCDGAHLTSPREEGMKRVMELALEDARRNVSEIDFICAHGTGTEIGDIAESSATHALFGSDVALSSLKGYVGHTLGACGAIEAAWCIAMMRGGFLVPNRNLIEVDPRCAPLDYVRELREARPRFVMNNNFAFGGINTSMILGPVA